MTTMTPLPKDSPIMVAWEKYKASDEYANSRRWAAHEQHVDGSMWAAFLAGFQASTPSPQPGDVAGAPIDMILFCPRCGHQHVDEPDERTPDWTNPPHRSHLCHHCKFIWRPADVATNGVREIKTVGRKDMPYAGAVPFAPIAADSEELPERLAQMVRTLGSVPDNTQISDTSDVAITAGDLRALAAMSRLRTPTVKCFECSSDNIQAPICLTCNPELDVRKFSASVTADSEGLRERLARMLRTLESVPDNTQIADTDVSVTAGDLRAVSRLRARSSMGE